MDAYYDRFGKPVFGLGEDSDKSSPSIEEVKIRFGEDTAEIYARSLERELTAKDLSFAQASGDNNIPMQSLCGWTHPEDMTGSAAMFIRDVVIEYYSNDDKLEEI